MTSNRPPHGFFITGTDTEVGKTAVATALMRALKKEGLHVLGFKPVAAGAERIDEKWVQEDVDALQAAASEGLPFDEICPACFEPPIAPHLAAGEIGQQISVGQLEEAYARISERKADCLVVEGAGGWLVPLNDEETLADFALTIDLPIILVVGIRLGCINHSLLTQANILSRGGRLAGWVANCIDPSVGNAPDQIDTLRDLLQAPLLQTFSWQAGAPLVWEGSPPRP